MYQFLGVWHALFISSTVNVKICATLVLEIINSLLNSSCIHMAAMLRGEHSIQLHMYINEWFTYRCTYLN